MKWVLTNKRKHRIINSKQTLATRGRNTAEMIMPSPVRAQPCSAPWDSSVWVDTMWPIKMMCAAMRVGRCKPPKSHSYHCPSRELKGATREVKGRVFIISLLARGGLERQEDEGLPWRDTQDLAIPYYFTPEGATSLNQTAEGSGDLGPTSNLPVWLHEVPARGRLHRQLATMTFWRWASPSGSFEYQINWQINSGIHRSLAIC